VGVQNKNDDTLVKIKIIFRPKLSFTQGGFNVKIVHGWHFHDFTKVGQKFVIIDER
jgi:hypothetical protein